VKKRLSFSVRDELAARIASGRLGPGAKLPAEPELAEELGVSRATLREALRSLEEDGFVTRTRGAGTYATRRPRLRNNLDVNFGVTEAIRAAGMRPGTMQIAVHTEPATEQVAADIDLVAADPVVILERVRTADGRPVVFSRDVVSTSVVSASEVASMPVDGSLYDVLERVGHAVANGIVTIEPTVMDRSLAKLLKAKVGVPTLFLRQIDFDGSGEPVLLSEEHHLAEAFEFTVVRRGPGRRTT
jgi:DNA-binding GntR family transcriptional regulator